MTRNQLAYWQLEEAKRSNRANEQETNRSNIARETETNRHNVVSEQETERHNRAMETFNLKQLDEQMRANQAHETAVARQQTEVERANLVRENQNQQSINLGWGQLALGYSQLSETIRNHKMNEDINLMSLQETTRNHEANEAISRANLEETARANRKSEGLRTQQQALDSIKIEQEASRNAEQARHNEAVESETHRSNVVSEVISGIRTVNDIIGTQQTGANNLARTLISVKGGLKW